MFGSARSGRDVRNTDLRVLLTMTVLTTVLLTALEFDDGDFVSFAVGFDFCRNHTTFDNRATDFRRFPADHQNAVKGNAGAFVSGKAFDFDDIAGGHAVLLATGFNDGVHRQEPSYETSNKPRIITCIFRFRQALCQFLAIFPCRLIASAAHTPTYTHVHAEVARTHCR